MTEIEKKALALVNEVRASHGLTPYENLYATPAAIAALIRAIEQHEAFRQEVSDSLEHYLDQWRHSPPSREVFACQFGSFIIAKPDPLVEAVKEASNPDYDCASPEAYAEVLRAAMKNRGYEWTKIVEDKR